MQLAGHPPPKPRWPDYVLIGLFFGVLSLPLLDGAFHFDPTKPQSENRLLANCPPPPVRLQDVKKYLADCEIVSFFGITNSSGTGSRKKALRRCWWVRMDGCFRW